MPSKEEVLKAKLMAKAEAAIEEMLKNETFSEQMTLSEIEAVITEAQKEMGEGLLNEILEVQELAQKPVCPSCGGRLRKKGKRRKQVLTVHGESQIEREYYQCLNCGAGIFPP